MRIHTMALAIITSLNVAWACPDTLIQHADVLTIDKQFTRFQDGDIGISGRKISYVGPHKPEYVKCAKHLVDAKGKIALPGFIDGHTHTGMLVYRGIGDDDADVLWKFMFPLEKKYMNRETAFDSALLSAEEMVRAGITTHADMYYFADDIAQADKAVGIRGIIGETIINFPSPDSKTAYGALPYAKNFLKKYRRDTLITPALAPHAPYTIREAKIYQQVNQLSKQFNAPILMHVAEQSRDEAKHLSKDAPNKSSVAVLDELGFLSPRLSMMHCVRINPADIAILKKHGTGCILNFASNFKGGLDAAPLKSMLKAGLPVGLGTDGPMSSNAQEMFFTMHLTPLMYRYQYDDPVFLKAEEVVRMATLGGAEALHIDKKVGSLEKGKLADIILIDQKDVHMFPHYSPYSSLVYAGEAHDVSDVFIDGKPVLKARQLVKHPPLNKARTHLAALASKIKQDYKL